MWYLDSDCSRHLTRDARKFSFISHKTSGHVTYGDNNKGKIRGIGKVQIPSSFTIENVLLVKDLKHNLLSISQLCDKGLKVTFEANHCLTYCSSSNELVLVGKRYHNMCIIDFENASFESVVCLLSKEDESWL